MTDENWVSNNWRVWLESQSLAQLQTSLEERESVLGADRINPQLDNATREHTQREITMITDELARRMEAERVKAGFFPRVKLRNLKDAQLIGQLLHVHAQEVLDMSQTVLRYKPLMDAGLPLGVRFVDLRTGQETTDVDQVLQDLGNRAIYTAELLAAVSEEISRLRDEDGVELSEDENNAFNAIVKLVQEVRKDTE